MTGARVAQGEVDRGGGGPARQCSGVPRAGRSSDARGGGLAQAAHSSPSSGPSWPRRVPLRSGGGPRPLGCCPFSLQRPQIVSSSNSSTCSGTRAGDRGGGVAGNPRCLRIFPTTAASVMYAITVIGPPHFPQTRTSTANTRLRSSAQSKLLRRERSSRLAVGHGVVPPRCPSPAASCRCTSDGMDGHAASRHELGSCGERGLGGLGARVAHAVPSSVVSVSFAGAPPPRT